MYTVEEIKNKVKTGTWTKEDVARCVEELKQISDFTVYTEEIYYISYGIFAYNFRERRFRVCRYRWKQHCIGLQELQELRMALYLEYSTRIYLIRF